jgi:hypothetical protein
VVPTAVSSKNSVATFHIAKRGRASNALEAAGGRSQMGGVRERQWVPTLTMDLLSEALPNPDFVKIDVEGAELMVLEGGSKVIREVRPVFYSEVSPRTSEAVMTLFSGHGYDAFAPDGRQLRAICSHNTFFIPQENHIARDLLTKNPSSQLPG